MLNSANKCYEHSWESFLKYGERKFLKNKSIIYRQGDIGNGFYYIQKGLIKITALDSEDNIRILDIVEAGSLIGEQAIDYLPYFSTAISIDDCVLYFFTRKNYDNIIQTYPEMIALFAESLIRKEKLLLNNINVTSATSEYQIGNSLLYLMNTYQNTEINMTQQDFSDYVGLTRITIYKILKKWSAEGVLSIKNRKIYILDPDALKKYVSFSKN